MVSIPFNGPFSPLRDIFVGLTAETQPIDSSKKRYLLRLVFTLENRSKQPVRYDSGLYTVFTTTMGTKKFTLGSGTIRPGKMVTRGGGSLKAREEYAFAISLKRSLWKVGSSVRGRATG